MTESNRCAECQMLMPGAVSDRLSPGERAQFGAHLAVCASCRGEHERLRAAARLLQAAYPDERSAGHVWNRIERTLRRPSALPKPVVQAGWAPACAAAAFVLLAALLFAAAPQPSRRPSPSVPVPVPVAAASEETEHAAAAPANSQPAPRAPAAMPSPKAAAPEDAIAIAAKEPPVSASETPPHAPAAATDSASASAKEATARSQTPVVTQQEPPVHPVPMGRPGREKYDDEAGLALLRRTGPVAVFDTQHRSWRTLVAGERVAYGARLRTGAGALAELAFGESRLRVDQKSELVVSRDAAARSAALSSGRLRVDLLRPDRAFAIHSGGGSVKLAGTVVDVEAPAPELAFVRVLEGHAAVSRGQGQALAQVAAGEEALLSALPDGRTLALLAPAVRERALALAAQGVLPWQDAPAGWAGALDQPRSKSEAAAGQLIVKDEQGREAEPLRVARMDIQAFVRGPEALTRIDQSFLNTTERTLEGTFYFPLPPGAAVSRFAMHTDEKTLVEGEVVERGQARAVYESILRTRRDPALLEWMEGNLFKARIFPIAPKSEKRVILEYTQLLPACFDTRRYVFPLVSELTRKNPVGKLRLRAELRTGDAGTFTEIYSPSYAATKISGIGQSSAAAELAAENLTPPADFVLTFRAPRAQEMTASAYAEAGEAPYLLLGYQPNPSLPALPEEAAGRDVLFILETSGARTPQDMAAQQRVLNSMLSGLSPESDRVALAAADTELAVLTPGWLPVQAAALNEALAALELRPALGALDFSAALSQAGDFLNAGRTPARAPWVIFIGSGIPALGELESGRVIETGVRALAPSQARFAGLGLGRSVEMLTLAELARRSGGFSLALKADEGLEEHTFQLALSLRTPLIDSPVAASETITSLYPASLGSLLPGQEIFLHGRLAPGAQPALSIAGRFGGSRFERSFAPGLPEDLRADPAAGRFWARARLDHLLAQPPGGALRREAIDLAQTWTLMSPYTSFLVLESNDEYKRYGINRQKRRAVWREEAAAKDSIQQEAEGRLAQARELFSSFEYEKAREAAEAALQLNPQDSAARELLTRTNDILGVRKARTKAAASHLMTDSGMKIQEKRVELDNRIDSAKHLIQQAQTDSNQSLADRIRQYDQTLKSLERAREALKWMPVEVNVDEQNNEVSRLITETLNASRAAKARLESEDREAASRLAEEQAASLRRTQERKLNVMADQARALHETGRDADAVSMADKILELDPANIEANRILAVLRERTKESKTKANSSDRDYLVYPENWKELQGRRGEEAREAGDETKQERSAPKDLPPNPGRGEESSAAGTLQKEVEALRKHLRESSVDNTLESKYGPNATVRTRNGALTTGGLVQVWNDEESRRKTPPLEAIPKAGHLFKNRNENAHNTDDNFEGFDLNVLLGDFGDMRRLQTISIKPTDGAINLNDSFDGFSQLEKQPASELEIYDVSDITKSVPDFPGPMISEPQPAQPAEVVRRRTDAKPDIEDVAGKLRERLAREFPASGNTVEERAGRIVLLGTPEVQARAREIIAELRSRDLQVQVHDKGAPPATVPVELTREQVLQLLAGTPKTAASAASRLQLYEKSAALAKGAEVYRALAEGIAEFGAGPHAEALARAVLKRLESETDSAVLGASTAFFTGTGLSARILARRAALEKDARKRIELLKQACEASGKDAAYLRPLCASLREAGLHKDAAACLEDALRQGQTEAWIAEELRAAYTALGDTPNALRAMTQQVAVRPREAEPRRQLARLLDSSGNGAGAVRELRNACGFAPENASLHRELAQLALKHKDTAAREWALLALLRGSWLSQDGDVWGEARAGLKALVKEHQDAGETQKAKDLDAQRIEAEATDIVAVMSWDTDKTDVDFHIDEPGSHRVSYQSRTSFRGGMLDRDNTSGYGPETYTLKHAAPGHYSFKVHYYRGESETAVKVKFTFKKGTPEERSETKTVKLKKAHEEIEVLRMDVP